MHYSRPPAAQSLFKVHRKTGLLYTESFDPKTNRREWVRFDTLVRGKLQRYPFATARPQDLAPLSKQDMAAIRAAITRQW